MVRVLGGELEQIRQARPGLPCEVGSPLVHVSEQGPALLRSGTEHFGQHPPFDGSDVLGLVDHDVLVAAVAARAAGDESRGSQEQQVAGIAARLLIVSRRPEPGPEVCALGPGEPSMHRGVVDEAVDEFSDAGSRLVVAESAALSARGAVHDATYRPARVEFLLARRVECSRKVRPAADQFFEAENVHALVNQPRHSRLYVCLPAV